MDCRTIQRYLSAYLDGEMTSPNRDAFFDHLAACDACRDSVGEAAWLEAALAGSMKRRITAPASVRYNVLNAIERESARRAPARRGFAWRPAAAMAAFLALAGAGWRSFTGVFQPAPVTTQAERLPAPRQMAALPAEPTRPAAPAAKPAVPTVEKSKAAPARPAAPAASATTARQPRVVVAPKPARSETPRVSSPASTPAPQAASAPKPAVDGPVGTVTSITAPPDVFSARFLARHEGKSLWEDATGALHARTHLQSGDETIVTMTLNDGTMLKSNQHTEFVVLRSPSKEAPSWGIRLIRGEVWVKARTPVIIVTPSMRVEGQAAEFSVRSMDGEDSAVMAVEGAVTAHNEMGSTPVSAGEATSASSGAAPEPAFPLANPRGQLDWAYGTADAD